MSDSLVYTGETVYIYSVGGLYMFTLYNTDTDDPTPIDLTSLCSSLILKTPSGEVEISEYQLDSITRNGGQCVFMLSADQAAKIISEGSIIIGYPYETTFISLFQCAAEDSSEYSGDTIASYRQLLSSTEAELDAANAKNADLQAQISTLEATMENMEAAYTAEINSLNQEISDLNDKILELQRSMISANIVEEL